MNQHKYDVYGWVGEISSTGSSLPLSANGIPERDANTQGEAAPPLGEVVGDGLVPELRPPFYILRVVRSSFYRAVLRSLHSAMIANVEVGVFRRVGQVVIVRRHVFACSSL